MKYLIIAILFASCVQQAMKEDKRLDDAFMELQRAAMWHREFSFQVIKFRGKNSDSTGYYEHKMDSVLSEYQYYMRKYNDLVEEHKRTSKN
jgi:hypothetical protein